jgi:flagellar hook assembly protein FlgD
MLGNSATHTISFIVGQNSVSNIVADKLPAYNNGEVAFDMEESVLNNNTKLILRVTDASGKLVWMTTTDNLPVTWDMKDMNGNSVPAGLYRYFGTYNDGINYGGTPINKLIVLDPVKTAN